ncbi:hypothetical protein RclHR1_02840016 [Rhizophagus clarus]|uniref:Uncharacterized protein n=1 Tax=Rhizophagus clarus TaxID=94130 RepID=A0A2Z6RHD6_9GLOM|nr:hypothetical protein RclHR1_02840016 [Rhizophagus clarus]
MAEAVKELTPAGNLKKPSYETVANWIFNYNHLGQENQLEDEVEILSDNEYGNEEDKEGETDDEYISEKGKWMRKQMKNMLMRKRKQMRNMLMREEKRMKRRNTNEKRMDMMMNTMVTIIKEQIMLMYRMIDK